MIQTRFVIDVDGTVVAAKVDPPTEFRNTATALPLPDAAVTTCVAAEFAKLTFPRPEGGQVTVVYPIGFNPGDAPDGGPAGKDGGPNPH